MDFYVGENYINITQGNVHIHDSYKVKTSKEIALVVDCILEADDGILKTRSKKSIIREWKAHNVLYGLRVMRKSTAHTDIEANQDAFHRIGYFLLSLLMMR